VIAGAGANIGVQVGEDGIVVVDAGTAADAPAVLAAIKRISPKPIRYVIDTALTPIMLAATKRSRRLEKNFLPPAPWAAAVWTPWLRSSRPRVFCGA
jgi:hypothetical protein